MLVLIAAYWPTAAGMVEIWARSDTFAHGFVVPVISAWLVWRHRALLRGATARPALWALAAVAVAGFGWLLGELAEVNALRQFALVALLILAVPAIAGVDVARRLAFPLAFLLFAVPFGEFLLPAAHGVDGDVHRHGAEGVRESPFIARGCTSSSRRAVGRWSRRAAAYAT